MAGSLDIIFEDDHILVINKPAGIAVQTGSIGQKDIESMAKSYRRDKGEAPEIYVVHRLDQPVSGILLLAKTGEAAAALSKGVSTDSFSKVYRAEVYDGGNIPDEGTLRDYLLKGRDNTSSVVSEGVRGAKEAILSFKVTDRSEGRATLRVRLKTGRHHQIRVQLSHAGFPILGDLKYANEKSRALSRELGISTVALTACELEFVHPISKRPLKFEI